MYDDPEYQIGSDDMKKTLKNENRLYKTALDHEVEGLKDEVNKVAKVALIAGGALVGTYLLVKWLKKDDEPVCANGKNLMGPAQTQVVVEKTVKENSLMTYLKTQLAFMFMAVIREKLAEFTGIEKRKLEFKEHELTGKTKSE